MQRTNQAETRALTNMKSMTFLTSDLTSDLSSATGRVAQSETLTLLTSDLGLQQPDSSLTI